MGRATNVARLGRRRGLGAWIATTTRGFGAVVVAKGEEEKATAAEEEAELTRAVECLEHSCTPPPIKGYLSLLKSCHNQKSLCCVKRIQAHLASHHLHLDGLLGENLVMTLVKCGDVDTAVHVFYDLPCRTTFSWTAIISGLVDKGRSRVALTMYAYMQEEDIEPDHYTFVSLLKACGSIPDLIEGKILDDKIRRKGLTSDVFVGTTLISMYGKCGALAEAENVWLELPARNIVTWNSMLSAYVDQGQAVKALRLYRQMLEEGTIVDPQTFLIVLQACCTLADKEETKSDKDNRGAALEIGRALHSNIRRRTYMKHVFIGNTLMSLYGNCDSIAEGENVFAGFSRFDVVSWTALISMYVELDQGEKALQSYRQMQLESVNPNQQTFVSSLQACCILEEKEGASFRHFMGLKIGQALHGDAQRIFSDLDAFVGTTLIGLYAKSAAMVEAEGVFSSLTLHTIVQWNGMLSAYVEQGQGRKALQCYRQLREEGLCPDHGTFIIALQACNILSEETKTSSLIEEQQSRKGVQEIGRALHADARKAGFASDIVVGTSLVAMYGKCGAVAEAETVFSGLSQHNIITWNALLSAYANQGQGVKALCLYTFLLSHISFSSQNLVTLICILQASSDSGCLEICQQLHFIAVAAGCDAQEFLASTSIHAYGNCASIEDAHAVFNGLAIPLVASWNACLDGHAAEGDSVACWHFFEELHLTCIKPTESTFTSLLSACSHSGFVDKGVFMLESMRVDFGLKPDMKQYVSLIDLLGRSGNLNLAKRAVHKYPSAQRDLSLWLCLLAACRAHNDVCLGEFAFDRAVCLQPMEAGPFVLMANVYGCTEMYVA
ncbi:hypothetical protein GOP47_0015013 [Adiantum capillus-veneris]|uniref:Pentatricopeptide repeat-containing protein n=1 Tax=Adiantum capillus-veneris TaxID=13818 RepID=A0A9D4UMT4_ADICA|nr:hypothetical protein GOP47_0015013 [Adiantum capillus-veneris]